MTIKSLKNTDPFSQAPMVVLLPVMSQLEKLTVLKTFFYARYEKVTALMENSVTSGDERTRLQAEHAMLLEVLDWLKMTPTKE